MDLQQHDSNEEKKPYTKPEAKRYPLRPEEAVLGFCKTPSGNGSNHATCTSFGICSSLGS